jgi:hypothetical protein
MKKISGDYLYTPSVLRFDGCGKFVGKANKKPQRDGIKWKRENYKLITTMAVHFVFISKDLCQQSTFNAKSILQ